MYGNNFFRRKEHSVVLAGVARIFLDALILAICHAVEEEGNNESSAESVDNHSIDYDDISGQDEWYADDPYMPTDDYIINKIMSASDDEETVVAEANVIHREGITRNRTREVLTFFVAGSVPIVGLAVTVLVSSIFLYYVRIEKLMRRYASEGVVVNGLILASYPDVYDTLIQSKATESLDCIETNNSYSMMSDDGSYQIAFQSDSGSDASEVHETDKGKKCDSVTENGKSHQKFGGENFGASSVQTASAKSSILVSWKKGKAKKNRSAVIGDDSEQYIRITTSTTSEKEADNDKSSPDDNEVSVGGDTNIAASNKKESTFKKYRVLVEYDYISCYDANENSSSRIIHKRLEVHGDDIQQTSTSMSAVKLHVLRDKPKSAYPSGEVYRSIRWQKRLCFIVHIVLGSSVVICMAFVVNYMLSPTLFLLYVGTSLLLLLFLNCFLQESFSEIIAHQFLENGVSRSSEFKRKSFDKQAILSALQNGTSFWFV